MLTSIEAVVYTPLVSRICRIAEEVDVDLELSTREVEGRLTVSVAGELDVHTAPELREQLISVVVDGYHDVIVDLTGVTFLDSTGLGVLVSALKRIKVYRGRLELVISRPSIIETFRITGLVKVFPIHPTLQDALCPTAGD